MTISSRHFIRRRLAGLASHLVVAIVVLVVLGGATRVMEAGLACPDWPLCYGTFLPAGQMNLQVFLEWFHRLDAFIIGMALLVQLGLTILWRSKLPYWLPWVSLALLFLVLLQGGLGALTVLQLLPPLVVTAHLALALFLLAGVSGLSQSLSSEVDTFSPLWWRIMSSVSLFGVMAQCLLGSGMATQWAHQICFEQGELCQWLNWHGGFAVPVALCVLSYVMTSLFASEWSRSQWPFLVSVLGLIAIQIALGYFSVIYGLSTPILIVAHQLVAALLVAFLSALLFKKPEAPSSVLILNYDKFSTEPLNG